MWHYQHLGRNFIGEYYKEVFIAVACLYVFIPRSVADIVSISQADLSSASITVFSAAAGEGFTTVFDSEAAPDLEKFAGILSPSKAHLVEWKPLTGLSRNFYEGVVYVVLIKDDKDYNMLLDYSEGYVYYNNGKYRLSDEEAKAFLKGLEELCYEQV